MKTLIVYYSFTENNEKLAHLIERSLNSDIHRIEELKKRSGFTILFDILLNRSASIKSNLCRLRDYHHVVFISPIWAGKVASPMKALLRSEKINIPEYSFITVCSGVAGQAQRIQTQLTSFTGKAPKCVTELWINDLLPASEKNKIRYATTYRIGDKDLVAFNPKIQDFCNKITI